MRRLDKQARVLKCAFAQRWPGGDHTAASNEKSVLQSDDATSVITLVGKLASVAIPDARNEIVDVSL